MTTPKKKLTQRQAWLRLAKAWGASDVGYVFIEKTPCRGLCSSISLLLVRQLITFRVYQFMQKKIRAEQNRTDRFTYLYDGTLEGAKQRAAFCRKQARRLK